MTCKVFKQRILYVCPLAHRGGHRPSAILAETMALTSAGFDVTLLTFNGFPEDNKHLRVQQITVFSKGKFSSLLWNFTKVLNHWAITKNITMLFEQFSTLLKAVILRKKIHYNAVHLRDGDPFVFLVFCLSFFLKNYNWILHMFFDPRQGMGKIDYAKLWRPIYRRSLLRNRFVFLCENEEITKEYERVMDGLFHKKAMYFPLITQYIGNAFDKEEARHLLKLPTNKTLLLCFGSLHSGKDIKVVASATHNLSDVCIIIAGKASPTTIDELKSITNNFIVRNYYVPEEEKALYYAAADAVIISYRKTFLERRSGAMLWDACKFAAPVIASNGGQMGELVKSFQVGLTFEPENALSLKRAIVEYLNLNQEAIKILKENCKKFCMNFSSESWSKRYRVIYDGVKKRQQ
jgi:glycosyltransferase involved in cell wall biosynthesis